MAIPARTLVVFSVSTFSNAQEPIEGRLSLEELDSSGTENREMASLAGWATNDSSGDGVINIIGLDGQRMLNLKTPTTFS